MLCDSKQVVAIREQEEGRKLMHPIEVARVLRAVVESVVIRQARSLCSRHR